MRLRLLWLALVLAFAFPAGAAMERVQGYCEQGGKQVVVTSTITAQTLVQKSYPKCSVSVTISGTATPATIYSDDNPTPTPLTSTFPADSNGYWFFYAPNGKYDVTFSGAGITAPFSLPAVQAFDVNTAFPPTDPDLIAIAALSCTVNQIIKRNGASTWVCAADDTGTAPTFATILSGTNTAAAMVVTTGASLTATGGGTIVATSTSGNAGTATALAANPTDCGANNFAVSIAANGDLTCGQPTPANLALGTLVTAMTVGAGGSVAPTSATVGIVSANQINGVSLAGLGTGIVKNTTGTGIFSIASAGDFPTLNQNTSGYAATVTSIASHASTELSDTANLARLNASNTWSTGTQDMSSATTTRTVKTGTTLPGTCMVGDLYYKTNVAAGQNIYGCTATNVWTLQGSAGAGGLVDPGSNGMLARTEVNTTASRTITGVANETVVTNGDGFSGNPTIGVATAVDFSTKTSTRPVKAGTAAPGTCAAAELFFDTDAPAGSNLYGCTATNTWTLQSGGSVNAVTQTEAFDILYQVPVAAAASGRAVVKTSLIINPATGNLSTPGSMTTGNGTVAGRVTLKELAANGTNYRKLYAADALTANLSMLLPDAVPGASGGYMFWGMPSSDISTAAFHAPSGNAIVVATAATTRTTGKQVQYDASGNLEATTLDIGAGSSAPDMSVISLKDEFFHGGYTQRDIGELGWHLKAVGTGAGADSNQNGASSHPGIMEIHSGTANNGYADIYLGPDKTYTVLSTADLAQATWQMHTIFKLSSALVDGTARIGLWVQDGPTTGSGRAGLTISSAVANFTFEMCSDDTTCTTADSGLAKDTAWHRVKIYRTLGDTNNYVRFCLDACGSPSQITSNIPSVGVSPTIQVFNSASGVTSNIVLIDRFEFYMSGLTRW